MPLKLFFREQQTSYVCGTLKKMFSQNVSLNLKENKIGRLFLSDWTNLVESPDESCFNEAWQRLQVDYKEKEYVCNFIKNTWLPFKEKIVKAWTGNHLHFGNRVTSRAEGAHAMLKRYLTVSTGNFHEVREKICLAIENQHNEITTKIASEKLRVIHKFRIPMFKELVTHVSIFALNELLKQYELATSPSLLDPCRSQFSNTMGLPCAHFMQNMRGEPLLLSDIYPQWRIDIRSFNMDGGVNTNGSDIESLLKKFHDKYKCMPLGQREDSQKQIAQLINAEIPLTLEPTIQPHKGRPSDSKKRKGDSSTTRDPSAFEMVEKARKCSVCHHVGHNRSTCQRYTLTDGNDAPFQSSASVIPKLYSIEVMVDGPLDGEGGLVGEVDGDGDPALTLAMEFSVTPLLLIAFHSCSVEGGVDLGDVGIWWRWVATMAGSGDGGGGGGCGGVNENLFIFETTEDSSVPQTMTESSPSTKLVAISNQIDENDLRGGRSVVMVQWWWSIGVSEVEFSIDCDGERGVATGVVMEMRRNICERENQGRQEDDADVGTATMVALDWHWCVGWANMVAPVGMGSVEVVMETRSNRWM
ncbi:hypothetical protein RHGRI_021027 [Rhododendron griersonianum]|uniref:Protein FAR1-RELATED SEQUENCE n=1 Tax=Rhododendron griersonianum TaxID=479676 RepID=A0AAV6JK00_9ERIC|nr:hypothetical protein RHGRI_021027 [Rhododendron griersonianum]